MGKDSELLEAARNGNVVVVEKILAQKSKRSGPLASLRRGPGANVQDSSGYSALHHAALNGHTEVVQLLLQHEASPNMADARGSSALHLAAWAGHEDIVRMLLEHQHRPANPNLQTVDRETPLHCAAQHGHRSVLGLLLRHDADPAVKNGRGETPLDLAAQYGRLDAVRMLVGARPGLLEPLKCPRTGNPLPHSPLHLASKNGHKDVVEVLLQAGVSVNLLTPAGTALHEAALCGKANVVALLLRHGADQEARDAAGRTPLQLLQQFPAHVTRGIVDVINNHRSSGCYDIESEDSPPLPPIPLGSPYENVRTHCYSPTRYNESAPEESASPEPDSSPAGARPVRPRASSAENRSQDNAYVAMNALQNGHVPSKVSPTPPKKPPRRNLSVSPTHLTSNNASDRGTPNSLTGAYEYLFLARSGVRSHGDLETLTAGLALGQTCRYEISDYVPMRMQNPRRKLKRHPDTTSRGNAAVATPLSPTHYQQPPTPEHPPPSALQAEKSIHERIRPLSQEYKRRSMLSSGAGEHRDCETENETEFRETGNTPLGPLTALGASSGSLSSSVSLSDRSASTDNVEEFVGDAPFAGLFKGSTMALDSRCPVPAERPKTLRKLKHVYENTHVTAGAPADDSSEHSGGERDNKGDASSKRSRTPTGANNDQQRSDRTVSVLSPFDEQEEWNKISEIMASFGTGLVRESVFVTELEKEFQTRLGIGSQPATPLPSPLLAPGSSPASLSIWLHGLGLEKYESKFMESGFDNVEFINGLLTESDLSEMGIAEPDDVAALLLAVTDLPLVAPPYKITTHNHFNNENNNGASLAVEQWLHSIQLGEYAETFRKHMYTDMERIGRVWEVELSAVLDIVKIGHRKRILHSLSGTQSPPGPNMDDIALELSQMQKNNGHHHHTHAPSVPASSTAPNLRTIKEDASRPASSSELTNVPTSNVSGGTLSRHSHRKSRPAPQPPGMAPPLPADDLEIRAPSELLLGVPSALRTQWRHPPLTLVTGSVAYAAYYLGSTLVKELRGTESTRKSMQKLKASAGAPDTRLHSSPPVRLAISHRGVQFINPQTDAVICEHAIRNIHCACQDADDLSHFAYITKDSDNRTHYCHVFHVDSMDQATEIILTLGQAFEVAYQLALREGHSKTVQPITPVRNATCHSPRAPIASEDQL